LDGKDLDVNGNKVSPSSKEAHIPKEQFEYKNKDE